YRLVASLFDGNTGHRIDRVARRFWVEKDPPFKKPFDLVGQPGFPDPYQHRQWYATGAVNNSPRVLYNTHHPAYGLAEASGDEAQKDYLFQVALEAAIHYVLDRPSQDDGTADYHPFETEVILGSRQAVQREEVPSKTYGEIARYVSEVRWRMLEDE
ncbi:MAG: hypothetical protein WBD05_09900, partial [Phycisphaerae bacterium]